MIQKFLRSRWPKRLLLFGCVALSGLFFLGAMAPEPRLRPREDDARPRPWQESIKLDSAAVDRQLKELIDDAKLTAASEAEWRIVCRRLSLALVGNSPSLEELRAIERIEPARRIEWWTDYLLEDTRWSHCFAERFSRAFVGTNEGPFLLFRRRKFQLWLADEFRRGTPYDQIVRKMLTGTGLWTDRPEVNFLTSSIKEGNGGRVDPIVLAGRTSRAFLGTRLDCLQCHDDMLGNIQLVSNGTPRGGTQLDFHRLAACFGGCRVSGKNALAGLRDDKTPYRAQLHSDEEKSIVEPHVPFLESLDSENGSPRERLAAWITHSQNKSFSRATANRVWAILFGLPLVNPVDDIPVCGPVPPALETLSDSFTQNDYQLKTLIRTIVSTRTFRRDSRLEDEPLTAAHESAWAVFPLTQLRPDQVARSMHQACRLQMIDDESSIIAQLERFGTLNDFTKEYGDRGEDEFISQSVTLPQRLLVMNGKFLREQVDENPIINASSQIALLAANDDQAIEAAYLSTLSRLPSENERKAFRETLKHKKGPSRSRTIGDLFWVLVNSTEFLWNH